MRNGVSVGSLEGQEDQRSGKITTTTTQVIKKLHKSWETTVYDLTISTACQNEVSAQKVMQIYACHLSKTLTVTAEKE